MVAAMEKPVRWMTLVELRDELERTRPVWEVDCADLDHFLACGQLPAPIEDADTATEHPLGATESPAPTQSDWVVRHTDVTDKQWWEIVGPAFAQVFTPTQSCRGPRRPSRRLSPTKLHKTPSTPTASDSTGS